MITESLSGRWRGKSRFRDGIRSENRSLLNATHCWRRVDFESFESFVREERKSTGSV